MVKHSCLPYMENKNAGGQIVLCYCVVWKNYFPAAQKKTHLFLTKLCWSMCLLEHRSIVTAAKQYLSDLKMLKQQPPASRVDSVLGQRWATNPLHSCSWHIWKIHPVIIWTNKSEGNKGHPLEQQLPCSDTWQWLFCVTVEELWTTLLCIID